MAFYKVKKAIGYFNIEKYTAYHRWNCSIALISFVQDHSEINNVSNTNSVMNEIYFYIPRNDVKILTFTQILNSTHSR